MEDGVFYGVELYVFEHHHVLFVIDGQFYGEDLGSVDELAHVVLCQGDVGGDNCFAVFDFHQFLAGFESAGEGEGH